MGFPSPAADFLQERINLDQLIISKPSATYLFRAGEPQWRAGIMKDALLVVDMSRGPADGSIVVCAQNGEFKMRIFRKFPRPHLQNIDKPTETYPLPGYVEGDPDDAVYGVVTWILNNASSGEFDDAPVI
ncbi:HumD family translesion DNA polymerase [Dryocola sp. BD626]|uniref:HumD family translesion DNA polymerase n=1 Tax=Dryocola sp. BD626 TaxID=3133273 RepID=UPI003F504ACC